MKLRDALIAVTTAATVTGVQAQRIGAPKDIARTPDGQQYTLQYELRIGNAVIPFIGQVTRDGDAAVVILADQHKNPISGARIPCNATEISKSIDATKKQIADDAQANAGKPETFRSSLEKTIQNITLTNLGFVAKVCDVPAPAAPKP